MMAWFIMFVLAYGASLDWQNWKQEYKRVYPNEKEELHRHKIWETNKEIIEEHNRRNLSWQMGLNKFSDLTDEEFKATLKLANRDDNFPTDTCAKISNYSTNTIIPDQINWTALGAVTPVANQGLCGSCSYFAATSALEGVWKIATGNLIGLSQQQLIDCSKDGNYACFGGMADFSYNYTIHDGLCSDNDYPYMAMSGRCRVRQCKSVVNVTSCANIYSGNVQITEMLLKYLVANYTVSAIVDASTWQNYRSGVIDNTTCYFSLNHAIAIVGYNDTVPEENYWIIKNSWGTDFGENGYVRIRMRKNMCGISLNPSVPIVNVNGKNYPDFSN